MSILDVIERIDKLISEAEMEPSWTAIQALRCLRKEVLLEEKKALLKYPTSMLERDAGMSNNEALPVRNWVDEYYGNVVLCPKCECQWMMGDDDDLRYCPKCGQAVKLDTQNC